MAVVVLASAAGAPGVTTTALGLAMSWPRPVVLVDADPVGGSAILAGYLQGTVGHNDAMVSLVLAHRDGRLGEVLPTVLMSLPDSGVAFLPGPRSHAQAASLADVWAPLAVELAGLERNGQDVIVDAGRLGMAHCPTGLVAAADLALLIVGSGLPQLAAARQWASDWLAAASDGSGALTVGCLLVGEGRPYGRGVVARTLGMPVVESVAWDPDAAAVFSSGRPAGRKLASSPLVRSFASTAAAIDQQISASRQQAELMADHERVPVGAAGGVVR